MLELSSTVSNLVELAENVFSVRVASFLDSAVCRGALSKGRSSSKALQPGLRRVCAVSVAAFYPAWTSPPTRLNCADDPTRELLCVDLGNAAFWTATPWTFSEGAARKASAVSQQIGSDLLVSFWAPGHGLDFCESPGVNPLDFGSCLGDLPVSSFWTFLEFV